MNKTRNQFDALSHEDQNHILGLCAKHTYEEAVDLLRQPRAQGGLDILTSTSALCRFFTNAREDTNLTVLAQHAAAANIRHEQHSNAFLGAIRATVEARVFESLRNGRALVDMEKDLRFLRTVENLYLADAQWRSRDPKGARPAYQHHVDRCAEASEIDFIPIAESPSDPANPIDSRSEFELDVLKARERQQIEAERKQADAERRAQIIASLQASIARKPRPDTSNGAAQPPKTPVIPHIPPDSTTAHAHPNPTAHQNAQSPTDEPKKPVPYVSHAPKIGRNDPCPCGSGRKAKKCCH
jgi:hypothetical protein